MKINKICLFLFLINFVISCNSSASEENNLKKSSKYQPEENEIQNEQRYGPFITFYNGEDYVITAHIESEENMKKYLPLFERNGLSGNGYSWEGLIEQILEKEAKTQLNHIQFDSEAGAFFAYADSEKSQKQFIKIIHPVFADISVLEKYMQNIDRSRIDD